MKIFFSRTTGIQSISSKFGTSHPWVKGIKVCSNEKSGLFERGENNKIMKILCQIFFLNLLKIHFNQTWHKASFGKGDSTFKKIRTYNSQKGDNHFSLLINALYKKKLCPLDMGLLKKEILLYFRLLMAIKKYQGISAIILSCHTVLISFMKPVFYWFLVWIYFTLPMTIWIIFFTKINQSSQHYLKTSAFFIMIEVTCFILLGY